MLYETNYFTSLNDNHIQLINCSLRPLIKLLEQNLPVFDYLNPTSATFYDLLEN